MKKLLILIIVIGLYSCKKENVYKGELIKQLNIDLKQTEERIKYNLYSIEYERNNLPEAYNQIDSLSKQIKLTCKNFEDNIIEINKYQDLEDRTVLLKNDIIKHSLNDYMKKYFTKKLKQISYTNTEVDLETVKKILLLNLKRFELDTYRSMLSRTSCGGLDFNYPSNIRLFRKNDSIVKIVINSDLVRSFPKSYEKGYINIKNIGDTLIVKKEDILDVYSFEILKKDDSPIKLNIDIFQTDQGYERKPIESFNQEIKIGEQKPFTLLDTIYK